MENVRNLRLVDGSGRPFDARVESALSRMLPRLRREFPSIQDEVVLWQILEEAGRRIVHRESNRGPIEKINGYAWVTSEASRIRCCGSAPARCFSARWPLKPVAARWPAPRQPTAARSRSTEHSYQGASGPAHPGRTARGPMEVLRLLEPGDCAASWLYRQRREPDLLPRQGKDPTQPRRSARRSKTDCPRRPAPRSGCRATHVSTVERIA